MAWWICLLAWPELPGKLILPGFVSGGAAQYHGLWEIPGLSIVCGVIKVMRCDNVVLPSSPNGRSVLSGNI